MLTQTEIKVLRHWESRHFCNSIHREITQMDKKNYVVCDCGMCKRLSVDKAEKRGII